MLKIAAKHIYETKKTESRGELGEILLHIACVQEFNAFPVLCKLILKTSPNDTVKGFDGVYVVPIEGDFQVWLGESKFYSDGKSAIADAIESIRLHILPKFISAEKAMIASHIHPTAPYFSDLKAIFKLKTSADKLFKKTVFPVLIAYDSDAVGQHTAISGAYIEALTAEVTALFEHFANKSADLKLRFHLIFVPLHTKSAVIVHFDQLLGAMI